MRRLRFMGRAVTAASLMVAAGVAVNQVLDGGKLSWSWGYLALVFTVLGALTQAAPQTMPPSPQATLRRKGSQRDYLRRVRSSVDQMETIGLVTQAEFVLRTQQVYVDVMLQPKTVAAAVTDSGIGPTPPPLEASVGHRASLSSFLRRGCVLAVLGAAGSGKTTLARYTALEIAGRRRWRAERREWWRRRQIPVLLYLRDHAEAILAEEPKGLPQIAVAAQSLEGVVPAEWLERRLARSQCVILLDGLDEVADIQSRTRVVRWVEAQISRYPGNAFVITSRPQGYDTNRLTRADILQVQRFTNHQIHAFLQAWYRTIEHRARQADPQEINRLATRAAEDLFQRINGRTTLYDLAANPLLLTMIANVHRYRGSLPGNRAALYEEVCQVLLHRRQEAKNLTHTELDGLSGDKKERIVQELALYMMRHRQRDIPVQDAQRAIRPVLERTAPAFTPEEFLTQARRSGLLLEHQYGHYGFAHLTLQEYLAAALIPGHASRRQLLIDNVSDPWWRETTLLWAARADASPVVAACLAARTVTALNLAYACADEASELDPALRAQLDQLLTTTPTDPDEIRLLDGVAAARDLQDTHALDDEGTRICARPISHDLWNRYATRARHAPLATGAAASLWTADLKAFLTWLNNLFTDGASYRLPSPSEARHALSSDLYPIPGTILYAADTDWASDRGQVRLVPSESAPHPHRPTQQQINAYTNLILDHTHLLFRLLFPHSALTFPQLLTYARPRNLLRPEHQLLHNLDLACALAMDHVLALHGAPALDPSRALARDRARDLAHDLDHARAFDRDRDLVLNRVITRARDLAHDLDLDLDLDPDLDGDSDVVFASNRARALAHNLGRALDLACVPDSDLARVPDSDLDFAHHLDLARALDVDLAGARTRTRTLDLTPIVGPAPGLSLDRDFGLTLDVACARAVTRSALGSLDLRSVVSLGEACLQLMRCLGKSESAESRRRRQGREALSLSQFLHHELSAAPTWTPADDPAMALDDALKLANSLSASDTAALIENALVLAAPLWSRSRPVGQSDMVLSATSVLAALTSSRERAPELARRLCGALCTLMALTPDMHTDPEDMTGRVKLPILVRT